MSTVLSNTRVLPDAIDLQNVVRLTKTRQLTSDVIQLLGRVPSDDDRLTGCVAMYATRRRRRRFDGECNQTNRALVHRNRTQSDWRCRSPRAYRPRLELTDCCLAVPFRFVIDPTWAKWPISAVTLINILDAEAAFDCYRVSVGRPSSVDYDVRSLVVVKRRNIR